MKYPNFKRTKGFGAHRRGPNSAADVEIQRNEQGEMEMTGRSKSIDLQTLRINLGDVNNDISSSESQYLPRKKGSEPEEFYFNEDEDEDEDENENEKDEQTNSERAESSYEIEKLNSNRINATVHNRALLTERINSPTEGFDAQNTGTREITKMPDRSHPSENETPIYSARSNLESHRRLKDG